ncbi:ROK family protein [Paenibacillus sp. R14(2021)]|uniref:ROK family protein n=1 Tax=Paenibacillus sp. R14(2021) TaxID=2859228 RepID=UPI002157A00D|nr:ROK family protein [Paenibacillus sp. R14(2021)]
MHKGEEAGLTAGIDVGGTKTLICIAGASGQIRLKKKVATQREADPDRFFNWLFDELNDLLSEDGSDIERLTGIGIGFPGVISKDAGVLSGAPAFGWPAVDIRPVIAHYYKGPVYLDNDVNLAALGELWQGSARGMKHVALVTVGTGIGSALILNGELYAGADGASGEIGNWIVDADAETDGMENDGEAFGPFEKAASGTGIGEAARKYFRVTDRSSKVLDLAGGQADGIDARHVLQAAAEGDESALSIMERPLSCMAVVIANMVSLLNPEVVVLGGGVVDSGDYYIHQVRERAAKLTPNPIRIVRAELGNEAGAIGAIRAIKGMIRTRMDT